MIVVLQVHQFSRYQSDLSHASSQIVSNPLSALSLRWHMHDVVWVEQATCSNTYRLRNVAGSHTAMSSVHESGQSGKSIDRSFEGLSGS